MKLYENYKKKPLIREGVLFALGISIVWPFLSWLIYYFLELIRNPSGEFQFGYYLFTTIEIISINFFLAPSYIELNFFSAFKAWIIIRFAIFAIFGYYNGLIYEKMLSKSKYSKTYFIVTSLLFYYILLGTIQSIGVIFYGGLP